MPKKSDIVKKSFDEVYSNEPKIVSKTRAKSGNAAAEKQKVAIALSKSRAAGAKIPKK